jgi:NADH-quinone oxidoreductase subunit C
MADIGALHARVSEHFGNLIDDAELAFGEVTLTVPRDNLREVALSLRDHPDFAFDMLIDVCGVDYLHYGRGEWETYEATTTGFERGVDRSFIHEPYSKDAENASFGGKVGQVISPRFGAVYHFLSISLNQRIRIRVFLEENDLIVPTVFDIWPAANWFEREAFDLFGIVFHGHPDLRRILTDYGFIGHPFRKDFPLIGNVEVRYDGKLKRVVYEPVSIEPRVLEPKVIRRDNRYETGE